MIGGRPGPGDYPHIETGERVCMLGGEGPNNNGMLFAIYPCPTWGYGADVLWDTGKRERIARLFDLERPKQRS